LEKNLKRKSKITKFEILIIIIGILLMVVMPELIKIKYNFEYYRTASSIGIITGNLFIIFGIFLSKK
jgi:competence protein ComGC